ncbi:MAG TPA: hypothetical protein VGE01_05005, partial [Fimbriimonas sp.]
LELRADGTFSHKGVTHGTWSWDGKRAVFQPTVFGSQSRDEMQAAAEASGRVFSLGFLFEPFELVGEGEALVTPDPNSLIYTEYRRI